MAMPLPPGKQLAVPPMRPDLHPDTREQILDYVSRRMFVEAINLAEEANYLAERGHEAPTVYAQATYSHAPNSTVRTTGEQVVYDPDDLPEFVDAVVGPAAEDLRDQHIGKELMDHARTLAKDPSPRARLGVKNGRARLARRVAAAS